MREAEEFDVVVVGGRVAGAATAMLLARQGHRVLVLDRGRKGSDILSTHALMRGGTIQLRRWGLLDRIVEAGTPPIRQVRFHYGDAAAGTQSTTVAIKPSGGVDALYAPRRTLLDRTLVDGAVEAGAQVRFGVNVTGLEHNPQGRVIGVVGRDGSGEPLRVHCRLTIGADGIRSLVAREVDAEVLRSGTDGGAFIYGHWAGLRVDGYEWFYAIGATAGFIPTNGGEVCVFAGTTAERFRAEIAGDIRAGYLRLLKEVVGDRVDPSTVPNRLWTFPGRPAYARRPWGAGWALVGDAGLFVDPLSTHGMTDAMRDAELLSHAADAMLSGEDEAAALAGYQSDRDRIAERMFGPLDRLAAYRWTLPEVQEILRENSKVMVEEARALAALTL